MVDIYQPREQSEPAQGDQPPKLSVDLRQSYVNYLTNGVTLGAGDFSDAHHGAGHPILEGLHNQLPSEEALIDSALGALRQSSLPITPELVDQTKNNLADHWARTGEHPSEVAADPVKADVMTRRPPLRVTENQFLDLAEKDESSGKNVKNYMFDEKHTASGFWQITNSTWKDTAPKIGVDIGQYPTADSAPRDVQKEVARQLFRDRGTQPWTASNAKLAQDINLPPDLLKPGRDAVYDPMGTLGAADQSPIGMDLDKVAKAAGIKSFSEQLLDVKSHVDQMKEEGASKSEQIAYEAQHNPFSNIFGVGNIGDVVGTAVKAVMPNFGEIALMSPEKEAVQASIRMATGQGRQFIAAATEAMEQFRSVVNQGIPDFKKWLDTGPGHLSPMWPAPDIMNLIDHIESVGPYTGKGSGGNRLAPNSPLLPVADALRALYQSTKQLIETELPNMTNFVEDYYRHMWTRPTDADRIFAGRTGTSANLKARSIPTMADGIAQGLKPRILDPIENTLHYITGMTNYLMAHRVLQQGKDAGHVVYAMPGKQPLGWAAIDGNSATIGHPGIPGATLRAHAPLGWASSYNNFVGRGFYEWGTGPLAGDIFTKIQQSSNFMTGMKLGLSGYHAFNIAAETMASTLASGIGKIAHGEIIRGLKDIGFGATVAPALAEKYMKGKWLQQAYLRPNGPSDPFYKQLADIYAKVGGRAVGRAAEYGYTQANNWWDAWRRGSLAMDLKYGAQRTLGDASENMAKRVALAGPRITGMFAHELARGMGTIMKPLFEHAIPKLKAASWADEMSTWMRQNPRSSPEAILAQGRKLSDNMDDRFGEMVMDNIFWNRALKQALNVGTVSVGWNFGTLRAIGGAAKDIANGNVLSTRARWLLSYPIAAGILGSAYQYLKTGVAGPTVQSPAMDAVAPHTGGMTPQQDPERALLPGIQKDPLQWFHVMQTAPNFLDLPHQIGSIAMGKTSPFAQMLTGIQTNQDWRGDPNFSNTPDPGDLEPPPAWEQFGRYVLEHYEPIGFEMVGQRKEGTEISNVERLMGIRPAPAWMQNPERDRGIHQWLEQKQQKTLQKHRASDEAQREK